MDIKLQIIIKDKEIDITQDLMTFCREETNLKNLGLRLSEGKSLLACVQKQLLEHQVADHMRQAACCKDCGKRRTIKGHHKINY